MIFDTWNFDGNVSEPTFSPSVKIQGKKTKKIDGVWIGEWERDADGKTIDRCCHYHLTRGKLLFLPDCTHDLAGKTVPLPVLPARFRDPA